MTISEAMGVIKTRESLPAGVGQMRVWLVDESKGLSDAFDKAVPFKHVDSIPDDLSEDRYLVVISPPVTSQDAEELKSIRDMLVNAMSSSQKSLDEIKKMLDHLKKNPFLQKALGTMKMKFAILPASGGDENVSSDMFADTPVFQIKSDEVYYVGVQLEFENSEMAISPLMEDAKVSFRAPRDKIGKHHIRTRTMSKGRKVPVLSTSNFFEHALHATYTSERPAFLLAVPSNRDHISEEEEVVPMLVILHAQDSDIPFEFRLRVCKALDWTDSTMNKARGVVDAVKDYKPPMWLRICTKVTWVVLSLAKYA